MTKDGILKSTFAKDVFRTILFFQTHFCPKKLSKMAVKFGHAEGMLLKVRKQCIERCLETKTETVSERWRFILIFKTGFKHSSNF